MISPEPMFIEKFIDIKNLQIAIELALEGQLFFTESTSEQERAFFIDEADNQGFSVPPDTDPEDILPALHTRITTAADKMLDQNIILLKAAFNQRLVETSTELLAQRFFETQATGEPNE
jgi:hypothetical protein